MEDNKIKGLPVALFIPATMYDLEVVVRDVVMRIPASGRYKEMYPDFEADKDKFECLAITESGNMIIDYNTLTEVLFASTQYPKLDSDTFFSMTCVIYEKESNEVVIYGNIMKFENVEAKDGLL